MEYDELIAEALVSIELSRNKIRMVTTPATRNREKFELGEREDTLLKVDDRPFSLEDIEEEIMVRLFFFVSLFSEGVSFSEGVFSVRHENSPNCRQAILWPFTNTSVWNSPLGSEAKYVDAHLFRVDDSRGSSYRAFYNFHSDDDYVIVTSSEDPLVSWFNQGHWGGPATYDAYCNVTGKLVKQLHFPSNTIVQNWGNNNAAGLLQPDGRTLYTMQPLYVCSPGAPILAFDFNNGYPTDIYNDNGHIGGHGGSGLSAVGGTIRLGELLPSSGPIRHALKLELWAHSWYYRPLDGNRSECYFWPANTCDGYAFDTSSSECYNGTDSNIRPGTLLAIPPANIESVNSTLKTLPAMKLLQALSQFGGYLVDDTAWNSSSICTEHGVADEFKVAYGFDFTVNESGSDNSDWYNDLLTLFRALYVVNNSDENHIGGGGLPIVSGAPPFC